MIIQKYLCAGNARIPQALALKHRTRCHNILSQLFTLQSRIMVVHRMMIDGTGMLSSDHCYVLVETSKDMRKEARSVAQDLQTARIFDIY